MLRKSTGIQSLFAWLLPICVGTAVGGGMIALLGSPPPSVSAGLLAVSPNVEEVRPALLPGQTQPPAFLPKEAPETEAAPPPQPAAIPEKLALPAPPPPPREPLGGLVPPPFIQVPLPPWIPLVDDVAERFRCEVPDIGGLPLLKLAVLHDDPEWIGQLIAGGVDASEVSPGGDTALCTAIRHMSETCVQALVYGGADPAQPGFENQPPLALASLRRGTEILRALTTAGADPNTRFISPVAKVLLDRVMIRDLRHALENDRGVTPLIACAARGDVEGAVELLRTGAKAGYCTTRYKRYPINFAATQGYLFLMRIILGRQPDSEPRVLVTVDLSHQRAWVTHEGQIIDSCPVSTGREGYSTPAGRYVITDKHRAWTSTLYHVSMPYFMRLNCSAIGLHSGNVTGRPASHGCIRLPYEKAKKFFSLVRVGDEVQIVH